MKTTGQLLGDLIEDKDITIERLSEAIGYSTKQISRWKKDQSEMGIEGLKKICVYFNITADYFLGLTKTPNPLPKR